MIDPDIQSYLIQPRPQHNNCHKQKGGDHRIIPVQLFLLICIPERFPFQCFGCLLLTVQRIHIHIGRQKCFPKRLQILVSVKIINRSRLHDGFTLEIHDPCLHLLRRCTFLFFIDPLIISRQFFSRYIAVQNSRHGILVCFAAPLGFRQIKLYRRITVLPHARIF